MEESRDEFIGISIDEMGFSAEADKVLKNLGLVTLEKLVNLTEKEIDMISQGLCKEVQQEISYAVELLTETHIMLLFLRSNKIPIEQLGLSVRAANAIHRMNVHTIDVFLSTTVEDMAKQRNVGEKTISEVNKIILKIKDGKIGKDFLKQTEERLFISEQIKELSLYSIEELELSERENEVLLSLGLTTIDKIVFITKQEFVTLKGLIIKEKREILKSLQKWMQQHSLLPVSKEKQKELIYEKNEKDYFNKIENLICPITSLRGEEVLQYSKNALLTERILAGGFENISEDNIEAVLEIPELQSELTAFFRSLATEDFLSIPELLCALETRLEFAPDIFFESTIKKRALFFAEGILLSNQRKPYRVCKEKISR